LVAQRPWREWSAPDIDGEATVLEPPLRFRIRPSVLQARIVRRHPGASPSAAIPEGIGDGLRTLLRRAAGRDIEPRAYHRATQGLR
jgi:hypothetical protein